MRFKEELDSAIDFNTVLEQVSAYASFSCSKENILASLPLKDKLKIQESLTLVSEACQFEQAGHLVSLAGASDISSILKKADKKMTCTSKELIDIYHFLCACKSAFIEIYSIIISTAFIILLT